MRTQLTRSILLVFLGLGAAGCDGFGTTCSTDADCTSKNSDSFCDPTLKVCFIRSGPLDSGLRVTSITPSDGATGVAASGGVVAATFNRPINDAGVGYSTFSVDGQGFLPAGVYDVGAQALRATFTPNAGGFAIGTNYTVNLTAGITGLAGDALTPFTSTFSTADGAWQAEQPYGASTNTQYYNIAASYFGQIATVVTVQIGTTNDYVIYGSVGDQAEIASDGGVTFTKLDGDAGETVVSVSTDVSGGGQAFAAWEMDAGTKLYARAASYDPGTKTWSAPIDLPVPLSTQTASARVLAESGNYAEAYWRQKDATGKYKVFGRSYVPGTGWDSSYYNIQADPNADCYQVGMATDLNYDLLATWQQAGTPNQIYATYFKNGGTFDTPAPISAAQDGYAPFVALGYGGTGAVAWTAQTTTGVYHVFARVFDPTQASHFDVVHKVDNASSSAFQVQLGVAANGDVTVVWRESVGTTGGSANVSRYTASTKSWSTPEVLVTDSVNCPDSVSLAVDPGGNALVAWVQRPNCGANAAGPAYGRRYTVGGGWVPPLSQAATLLQIADAVIFTDVVVDGTGYGTVAAEPNGLNGGSVNVNYLDYVFFQ
jgi:hypothetical protein